jgi:hypothetical protein
MKAIKISQMVMRAAFLLALILGIAFWINPGLPTQYQAVKGIHMLLGIIVVIALWIIGLAQGRVKGGSFGLALGTFVIGLAVLIVGLGQESWKLLVGGAFVAVQVINIVHLLLNISAIGFGEMLARRSKRLAEAEAA